MADFMDVEAEESSESEPENSQEKRKRKRKERLSAMNESDDDDDDEEEDDEDNDDPARLRQELDDLIDDNSLDEDEAESDGNLSSEKSGKRKKNQSDDFDDALEDDDYDLIEENLGITVERKKRFKRLRRIEDGDSDEEREKEPEEEKDAIANELFDDSGDDEEEVAKRNADVNHALPEPKSFTDVDSEADASDPDDFIVDDEGRPMGEKRRKKRPVMGDASLQEAQDIFGIDFDYDEFNKYGRDEDEDEEEEDDEDDEDEDEYAEDDNAATGERRRRSKKARKKRDKTGKTIFEVYEPSELKRGHFTDFDNEIRSADIPERMQLRIVPVTSVPEGSDELNLEARWIYDQAFCRPTISIQDAHLSEEAKERARKGPQTVGKIRKALDFMRNQNFEVPFISFYRKEYVNPELNINDLWKVYKWDAKWCELRTRKENLVILFEKMKNYRVEMTANDLDATKDERAIREEDIERLRDAETSEEFNDIYQHFVLYRGHEIPAMQAAARLKETDGNHDGSDEILKQAEKSGTYAACRKAGLDGFAKKFGLTPEQYGENLRDNYQRHDIEQESTEPYAMANAYRGKRFGTAEETIEAVRLMVAMQLAREPLVRKCVREMYMERAKITITPTKKGVKEIDENHPISAWKYLRGKPVRELVGDEFLKLTIAERDKLVTISLSDNVEGNTSNDYLAEMKQLYHRDEFSKNVQEWNALRAKCVEIAFVRMLLPDLKKELRSRLMAESKEFVLRSCSRKMYNWIKVAPYACDLNSARGAEEDEEEEEEEQWDDEDVKKSNAKSGKKRFFYEDDDDIDGEIGGKRGKTKGLRIMGLAYVPDYSQAAFACLVSPDGECTDYLRLPHILKRKNSPREEEKTLKEADLLAMRNFIANKRPHAIVIGGESREAIMLRDDIGECITELVSTEGFPKIPIEIVENEFAKIYGNSNRGNEEFRDYPIILRQAISIARRLQDPLLEFAQLCGPDNEILCLQYHTYQNEISKEDLLESIHLEFVNRVNEVGVDLNRALQHGNSANLVQFVCGLGIRKGQAIVKLLKRTNKKIENRTQLVTVCHMGPKVFINCAGFIKIDTSRLGDSTEGYVEVLDGTRIHPETYEWARKMAVDALEYENDDEDEEHGADPSDALQEILQTPERLKDLDLDAFALELERQGFGNKCTTLYDIRAELTGGYKDLRTPYESPTHEKLFNMLTKETPETFYIGKLILATVSAISRKRPEGDELDHANPVRNDTSGLWQCPFCLKNDFPDLSDVWNHFDAGGCPGKPIGVRLRLDNAISGFIHLRNLSDKRVDDPEQRVRPGQVIHCRVIKIDVSRFSIECSSKSSDLADKNHEWRPQRDRFYDSEAEEKVIKTEEEAKMNKQRQSYVKRVIVHNAFHNVNYMEAAKLLEPMKQGEAIVRPSSKGCDRLTITWKVTDDVLHHIDVREDCKKFAFSLGKRLYIGNEEFEDLDEIIARHVNPMAAYASELLDCHYYKNNVDGIEEKANEIMKEQKMENPGRIPCILSASKKYPGKFLLSYLPREKCVHEYISVSPDGVRYRGRTFARVGELFDWFRKHFRDPRPAVVTPQTSAAFTPNVQSDEKTKEADDHLGHHTLSMSASDTPYGFSAHTPGTIADSQYSSATYLTTPYTPTARTPYMTPVVGFGNYGVGGDNAITPYQTPNITGYSQFTPGYGGVNNDASQSAGTGWPHARSTNFTDWKTSSNIGNARGRGGRGGNGYGRGGRGASSKYDSSRGGAHSNNYSSRHGSRGGHNTPLRDESISTQNSPFKVPTSTAFRRGNRRGGGNRGNYGNGGRSGNSTPLWDENESWDEPESGRKNGTNDSTTSGGAATVLPAGGRTPLYTPEESWDDAEETPVVPVSTAPATSARNSVPLAGSRTPLYAPEESWDEAEETPAVPALAPRAASARNSAPPAGGRTPLYTPEESWDEPEGAPAVPASAPRAASARNFVPPVGGRTPLYTPEESWDEPEVAPAVPAPAPRAKKTRSSIPAVGSRTPLYTPEESWDEPETNVSQNAPPPSSRHREKTVANVIARNSRPIGSRTPLYAPSESWDNDESSSIVPQATSVPITNSFGNARHLAREKKVPPSVGNRSVGSRTPLYTPEESWDDDESSSAIAQTPTVPMANSMKSAQTIGSNVPSVGSRSIGGKTPLYAPEESWDEDESSSVISQAPSIPMANSFGNDRHSTNEKKIPPPVGNRSIGGRTPLYAPEESWDDDEASSVDGGATVATLSQNRDSFSSSTSSAMPRRGRNYDSSARRGGREQSRYPRNESQDRSTRNGGRQFSRPFRGRPSYDAASRSSSTSSRHNGSYDSRDRSSRGRRPPVYAPIPRIDRQRSPERAADRRASVNDSTPDPTPKINAPRSPLYDESESWD